jgi:cytidylate kinase
LADSIGYLYFDTGAIYRALTVLARVHGVADDDETALADLAERHPIDVVPRPESKAGYGVVADGDDLTARLRGPDIDGAVSLVSSHPKVRTALLAQQRRVAGSKPTVMVGRDIGTVVLPDADLKIYLDASAEARARRRYREMIATGSTSVYRDVLESIEARDAFDAGRSAAPLAVAPDAVVVDTDLCNVDEVVEHLKGLVERWPDSLTRDGGESPCRPK